MRASALVLAVTAGAAAAAGSVAHATEPPCDVHSCSEALRVESGRRSFADPTGAVVIHIVEVNRYEQQALALVQVIRAGKPEPVSHVLVDAAGPGLVTMTPRGHFEKPLLSVLGSDWTTAGVATLRDPGGPLAVLADPVLTRRLRPAALLARYQGELVANTVAYEHEKAERDLADSARSLNEVCKTSIELRADWSKLPDRFFLHEDGAFHPPSHRCEDVFHGDLSHRCDTEQGRARVRERVQKIVCRYRWRGRGSIRLDRNGTLVIEPSLLAGGPLTR